MAQDAQLEFLKVPPHSLEAEQSVLGGLLLENDAWERCGDVVTEHDFYRHDHRLIYRYIVRMIESNNPADVITVAEALEQAGELSNVGGVAYLGSLAKNTPSAANIRRYAEIVRERSIQRKLASAGTEISDMAYNPSGRDIHELLDEAESKVFDLAEQNSRTNQGLVAFTEVLKELVDDVEQRFHAPNNDDLAGISTGFTDLDRLMSGLEKGDLIIVAARPSMGKTAFVGNIAEHVAMNLRLPVAFFSMEMGNLQIGRRLVGSVGKLDAQRLKTGRLIDEDWPKLTRAISQMNDMPLHLDESGALSVLEIRARARRLQRQYGSLALIVVDYLQLMKSTSGRSQQDNREREVADICRSLKSLAKELQVPVIALSQLNRSLESRPNKRPVLSDLRDSGSIEQDADQVIFIYRDEMYNPESEHKGIAEIIIGKARNGPVATVKLAYMAELTRFANHADYR